MTDLDQRIANLSLEQRALLEQRSTGGRDFNGREPGIPRIDGEGPRPTSFAQQRLLFLDQLEPGSPLYNISRAIRICGDLNVAALEQSLSEILRRHQTLRTTFVQADGGPLQVVGPATTLPLPLVDLRELPQTEREARAQELVAEEAQRPFDLARGPLLRGTLLALGDQEHLLLLTMHHVVSDGWSMGVFFREMAALYGAFSDGKPSPLPELPIHYADFAQWQREWLHGDVLEAQLSYWKQQLGNGLPVMELPNDRPRPAVQTYRGAKHPMTLSLSLTEALKALGRQERVTLFMILLAAFQTLLHRYSGQDDIVVGSPIAGRNKIETEGLIGFFVNTLVLRTDLSGEPTFRELLGRVREVALGAYEHQDLPFEKLVDDLHPERNPSHSPLCQVMLAFQNTPMQVPELPGLVVSVLDVDTGTSKFDLSLFVTETELGLQGSIEYNTGLFDDATISRMIGHFQILLEGIVANPDEPISTLPLLTEEERHQLLVEWNVTRSDYPRDRCIHQLFEAQVDRTPDAVAVVYGNEHLTYRALNRRANQLAHYLKRRGVEPETLVGIRIDRCPDLIVGMLGVLKAGGAYVPMDPADPVDLLEFVLEDTQVAVLLTQQRHVEGLSEQGPEVVCVDSDWQVIAEESPENPECLTSADNLAYVIYTSGSTGRPKGVAIPHKGLLNLVYWHLNAFKVTPSDRATQLAGTAFDASVWEIWPYLAAGASLFIAPPETIGLPVRLRDWLVRNNITITFLPTPLAERVLLLDWPEGAALRILLTGGDQLHRYPSASLPFVVVNNYGPTENTVVTTHGVVSPSGPVDVAPSIGRPIANAQVYILDRLLQPVPIGVPGELCIAGEGLAREYINQPGLSAEKFIPNPFSDEVGSRLYRTGDLARYLPDGNIEFLARMDDQVQIRGFRVELGEIELVLGKHPMVRQTVVIVREDVPGGKRLVAYVVPNLQSPPTINELRGFLQEKLPAYMVPTAFVMLDDLPLTPNGKVDRHALPEPSLERSEGEKTFLAPRDTLELQLTMIFTKVLGVQPVGVRDDFFELGGDSLSGMALFAEIEETLGKKLPLAILFQAPTVEQLAGKMRQEGLSVPWSSLVAVQPHGAKLPFFCVHGGEGHVLGFADLAQFLGEDQPFYGLEAPGRDGEQDPLTRIEDLAAHYIEAIRGVQPKGPYLLGGHCLGGLIAFEMAQQLRYQGQETSLLAMLNTGNPALFNRPNRTRRSLQRLFHWTRRFAHHGHFLVRRPLWEHPSYIFEKVQVVQKIMTRRSRIWKVNHRAAYSYLPKSYPGQAVVFLPQESPPEHFPDSRLGWKDVVAGGVEFFEVPGDLRTMLLNPHVNVLGKHLKDLLDSAQSAGIGAETGDIAG